MWNPVPSWEYNLLQCTYLEVEWAEFYEAECTYNSYAQGRGTSENGLNPKIRWRFIWVEIDFGQVGDVIFYNAVFPLQIIA
jgi:hypothetical protein